MRTIKFRGKRIENSEWVYGGFTLDAADVPRITTKTPCETGLEFHKVIPKTVGQFTGLHDKNGKEIYEGDIVRTNYDGKIISIGDIQFDCGVFGAEWTHNKKNKSMLGSWSQRHNLRKLDDNLIDNIEVIGNIHDNPELLNN